MSISIPLARSEAPSLRRFLELDLLDNRYPALHGMRVLGIVSVVQLHVTSILALEEKLPLNPSFATTSLTIFFGMDLFFVLSGFLIGSILLRSVEVSGSQHVRRFYLRRVFRTFPSYYVVLTYLALTTAMTAAQRHNLRFEYTYLTNYTKLTREGVLMLWGWSLGLEEQFYLTVPLLFFVLNKLKSDRVRLALLGVFWASACVVRLVIYLRGSHWTPRGFYNTVYFKTHTRFDTLVAGIILAYVQRKWHTSIARWLEAPFARALLGLVSLSCLWILLQPWMFGDRWVFVVRLLAWGTITSIMYFAGVLLIVNGGAGWLQRALSIPFFRRAATLGYGVYLVHIPVCDHIVTPLARWLAKTRSWSMVIVWPLSVTVLLAASFALSYCLHVLVEKPSLKLRDRLAK